MMYKLITTFNDDVKFTDLVNELLNEGYKLHGDLQVTITGSNILYTRELIKETQNDLSFTPDVYNIPLYKGFCALETTVN